MNLFVVYHFRDESLTLRVGLWNQGGRDDTGAAAENSHLDPWPQGREREKGQGKETGNDKSLLKSQRSHPVTLLLCQDYTC